jgi:hypothetical protein
MCQKLLGSTIDETTPPETVQKVKQGMTSDYMVPCWNPSYGIDVCVLFITAKHLITMREILFGR